MSKLYYVIICEPALTKTHFWPGLRHNCMSCNIIFDILVKRPWLGLEWGTCLLKFAQGRLFCGNFPSREILQKNFLERTYPGYEAYFLTFNCGCILVRKWARQSRGRLKVVSLVGPFWLTDILKLSIRHLGFNHPVPPLTWHMSWLLHRVSCPQSLLWCYFLF